MEGGKPERAGGNASAVAGSNPADELPELNEDDAEEIITLEAKRE